MTSTPSPAQIEAIQRFRDNYAAGAWRTTITPCDHTCDHVPAGATEVSRAEFWTDHARQAASVAITGSGTRYYAFPAAPTVPTEPPEGTQVLDKRGNIWTRHPNGWALYDPPPTILPTWPELLRDAGPVRILSDRIHAP